MRAKYPLTPQSQTSSFGFHPALRRIQDRGCEHRFVQYIEVCICGQTDFFRAMDLRERFATNLRRIRHAKGLSQDELALEAGMSRSYIAQLETGKYFASLKIIGKLATQLGVDPAEFLKQLSDE